MSLSPIRYLLHLIHLIHIRLRARRIMSIRRSRLAAETYACLLVRLPLDKVADPPPTLDDDLCQFADLCAYHEIERQRGRVSRVRAARLDVRRGKRKSKSNSKEDAI